MNRSDLQTVARLRVREAKTLLDNGYYSGAYYLLGYAIECALKACIAKQINRHDFPDRRLINDSYTHDLEKLLNISGLKRAFEQARQENGDLDDNWAIVQDWHEDSRYNTSTLETAARGFYSAVAARNGVLAWLKKRW